MAERDGVIRKGGKHYRVARRLASEERAWSLR
jgi:hypothetical protein